MKKFLIPTAIAVIALFTMSFYQQHSPVKYEYMTIHAPVSINKPTVFISRAASDMQIIDYKKNDFDMSTELARIQRFEDEGWELMQVVNQNSAEMNIMFILRKPR